MNTKNRRTALQRVQRLFQLAKRIVHEDQELAQRYAFLARRIAMASRVRIPKEYRRHLCRNCKKFISPGVNCRVRIQQHREPHVVVTCGYCGKHMRFPMRNRKEKK
ncbi:MAG: ribonuclease P protein component 4 [Candidatus Bathyarchaeia archaeon]